MKPSWQAIGETNLDSVPNSRHKHCFRELGRVRGAPFRCAPVGACSLFPTCRARTRDRAGQLVLTTQWVARKVSVDCPVPEGLDCSGGLAIGVGSRGRFGSGRLDGNGDVVWIAECEDEVKREKCCRITWMDDGPVGWKVGTRERAAKTSERPGWWTGWLTGVRL